MARVVARQALALLDHLPCCAAANYGLVLGRGVRHGSCLPVESDPRNAHRPGWTGTSASETDLKPRPCLILRQPVEAQLIQRRPRANESTSTAMPSIATTTAQNIHTRSKTPTRKFMPMIPASSVEGRVGDGDLRVRSCFVLGRSRNVVPRSRIRRLHRRLNAALSRLFKAACPAPCRMQWTATHRACLSARRRLLVPAPRRRRRGDGPSLAPKSSSSNSYDARYARRQTRGSSGSSGLRANRRRRTPAGSAVVASRRGNSASGSAKQRMSTLQSLSSSDQAWPAVMACGPPEWLGLSV